MEVSLEEAFHGKATEITVDVSAQCDTCHGSGAKPGTHASTCRHCNGHGKVRAQQGFFVVERACPVCQGSGQIIADPCPDCRGEGRIDKTKTLSVNVPPGVNAGEPFDVQLPASDLPNALAGSVDTVPVPPGLLSTTCSRSSRRRSSRSSRRSRSRT